MGDLQVEDIIAEPDEPVEGIFTIVGRYLHAYGWYIIAATLCVYAYYKNQLGKRGSSTTAADAAPKSEAEVRAWQLKEEQRLKAVQKLQERYSQDSAVRAERQQQLEEEKKKARLEEMEKLTGKVDVGQKLGDGDNKSTLRPGYNPLMGDQGSSARVCFRRPGGGSG